MSSQFELLTTRRFLPFFLTQALGAFNDNIFKNSLMLLMAFTAASNLPMSTDILMNLAAGLFILPFFLFSASAGELADNMEKSRIIRWVKLAEILLENRGVTVPEARYFWPIPLSEMNFNELVNDADQNPGY